MIRFSQKKGVILLLYVFFVLLSVFALYGVNSTFSGEELFLYQAIILVIDLVITLIVLKACKINYLSLSSLFILCSYLFNFGQILLYGLFVDNTYIGVNYLIKYNETIYKPAVLMVYVIHVSLIFGILLTSSNSLSHCRITPDFAFDYNRCRFIRNFIMLTCFPLEVILVVIKIIYSKAGGYGAILAITGNDGISTIARFYIIAFVLSLFLARDENKFKVLIVEMVWLCFSMLSGDRHYAVANMLMLLFFYSCVRREKKIKFKTMILVIIGAFIAITFVETINFNRMYGELTMDSLINNILYVLKVRNPLFAFLNEFGASLYTPIGAYDYVIRTGNYAHGSTFLFSWVYALPNVGGLVAKVTDSINFGKVITEYGLSGGFHQIGGAYTGEMIYNFKFIYPLCSILLGVFISSIEKKIINHINNGQIARMTFYVMAFNGLLFYVRGYFYGFIRQWAWSALLLLILISLYNCKSKMNTM